MDDGPRFSVQRTLASGVLTVTRQAAWGPQESMEEIAERLGRFCIEVLRLLGDHPDDVIVSDALLDAFGRAGAIQKALIVDHPARRPQDRKLGRLEHLNQIRRALPTFAGYLRTIESALLSEFPSLETDTSD